MRGLAAVFSGFLVLVASLDPAHAAEPPIGGRDAFAVGPWSGYAYYGFDGEFDFCVIAVPQTRTLELRIQLGGNGYSIVLFNLSWRLTVGDGHPVTARVDDRWRRRLGADIYSRYTSSISLGGDLEAVAALRRGRTLILEMPERTFRFSLADSSAAIAALQACYGRHARPTEVAEAPATLDEPAVTGDSTSTNPFAPAGPARPGPSTAGAGPPATTANPFAPAPADSGSSPRAAAGPPAGEVPRVDGTADGTRPRPDIDGLQRIVPYLTFEMFTLSVTLFLPGDPQAVATPDDLLSDYRFEGRTETGRYRGLYLEAALRGATAEVLLDYLMWIEDAACDGATRSAGREIERVGDTTVGRETIKCLASRPASTRSVVVSGSAGIAQIFIIDGGAAGVEATAATFRMLTGLAREG